MNLKKTTALVLFCIATACNSYAVNFVCFESKEDCKGNGPFLNVEWITAVRHVGSGQIELWFDGWSGIQGTVKAIHVDWDRFLSHVIQKQDFKQFADYYIKDRYLRRVACSTDTCDLRFHPYTIWLDGAAVVAMKAYIAQQAEAGRLIVLPST